ncbi:putative urate catabolism protein [Hyella patelloides LEGE 07179]|uniref:Putative urate catabolism protein n=1 Tax=Hyella patelloides LEGE 07179 TaxID=945734 RepID=A0A563VJH3_9CYAN|nr:allantoinase PuuE [Hyella patelloides]VEP11467.1 putative urate catabolism protein [Hyella patelloides LEGE 07179]
MSYPRDLIGYGANPPHPQWPGDAKIALQIVLNYEEGSEYSIPDGDETSEIYLREVPGSSMDKGMRDLQVESVYEYGSRAGFWRLMRLFADKNLKVTIFGAALALERNPAAAQAIVDAGYDICCHGWRWIGYHLLDEAEEREHITKAVASLKNLTGDRPLGWYCRYAPSLNTRRLIAEEGGFLYDSDAYNDDLPYWVEVANKPHLVIPYTLDNNDMKYCVAPGFNSGNDFYTYLKDAFDVLYAEGETAPKMMSVGLHARLAGKPGRIAALARFIDYVQSHERVWICRRLDIAQHWIKHHSFEK